MDTEPVTERVIIKLETHNRVIGMLMHLWGLVKDDETRQVIDRTIKELQLAEEE